MEEVLEEVEDVYVICAACYSLDFGNGFVCSHCHLISKGTLSIPASEILDYKIKSREDVNPSPSTTICSRCYCRKSKSCCSRGLFICVCVNCNSKNNFDSVKTRDLSKYPMKTVLAKPKISVCRVCEKEEPEKKSSLVQSDPICSCGSSEFVKIVRSCEQWPNF